LAGLQSGVESGFRDLGELRTAALQAQRIPARESAFRLLYLNQRVKMHSRFIALQDWQACGGEIDVDALRGRPCSGGLDLSSTQDLTALVLYFPDDGGAVLPFFWVPRHRLQEREDTDWVPYETWFKAGLIDAPQGRAIDRSQSSGAWPSLPQPTTLRASLLIAGGSRI
jgi:phage terminase large subunit-like protein